MATLTFQKASWCLQITRSSRLFSVSFSTSLPRKGRSGHLPPSPPTPLQPSSSSRRTHRRSDSPRTSHRASTRRDFTSTRVYRAQQEAAAAATRSSSPLHPQAPQQPAESIQPNNEDFSSGLNDKSLDLNESDGQVDWTRSFSGLSNEAFSPEAAKVLLAPVNPDDVEVKPDGILYLPEIKYRRILNLAFGPGAWGLAPRGETIVTPKSVTREYALVALGRLVSVARGEQDYFTPEGIPTAVEGCKSTALRRCCKDLGVASELWDPRYIRRFMSDNVKEVFVEHQVTKKRRKLFLRKEDKVQYPYKETKYGS